jgi:hypothetical protein
LEQFVLALETSPFQLRLSALAYDARIPETIFQRLIHLRQNPEDAANIQAEDFHIVLSNILFRYPTVKIWQEEHGAIFIEI